MAYMHHEAQFSSIRVFSCGETEGHGKANSRIFATCRCSASNFAQIKVSANRRKHSDISGGQTAYGGAKIRTVATCRCENAK
jgi:hypothetical protein